MNKISIDLVAPGRVETTIQPEQDWKTQIPYTFVFTSLPEAIEGLPELYTDLEKVNCLTAGGAPNRPRQ